MRWWWTIRPADLRHIGGHDAHISCGRCGRNWDILFSLAAGRPVAAAKGPAASAFIAAFFGGEPLAVDAIATEDKEEDAENDNGCDGTDDDAGDGTGAQVGG